MVNCAPVIDFKKAFDSVWHYGLFYKLLRYKIGGKFYDLLKKLHSKARCSVEIFLSFRTGVRQGCIISLMLFNLYLSEIPFLLVREDTDPIILNDDSNLNFLLYANDLVLVSHFCQIPTKTLSILANYFHDWMLSVNPKKTKVVIFQKKCRKLSLDKCLFQINDDNIDIVSNYIYFGINFPADGNFRDCKASLKDKTRG